jgi:hypothetical protein
MANPNIALLTSIAHAMGSLREQVVFVGGCATGLLITQPTVADARATEDVDAMVEVASLVGYHALAQRLVALGFKQTMADNTPPFRWYWNGMQLDLVPLDEKVLGFANRWYKPASKQHSAQPCRRGWCSGICRRRISWQRSWRLSKTGATTTYT